MMRLIPYPFLSAAFLATWLLLTQSFALGQWLLGIIVAMIGGWLLSALDTPKSRFKRPLAAVRLFSHVVVDIVRSNFAVAAIVLGLKEREWSSGFVDIPLQIRNPYGLISLSIIITSTPGTVWVDFEKTTGQLRIHVLDLVDHDEWRATIKGRYERLLLEIFE
ncbi:MAG: Na+/H+ antiporter subunit E [Xanthobacteraceae bacterium]|nr:Na+/H+ antiporter subunit E [Xanthobacteraceae bacterium]